MRRFSVSSATAFTSSSAASSASSARYCCLLGAVAFSAHASRWRIMGTCASQHDTEQKNNPVRLRLQVDTLQRKYALENAIGRLHSLHSLKCWGSSPLLWLT